MKKSLKKGGIGDVVTLIIIVGLCLALIVAVVIPMITRTQTSATSTADDYQAADDAIDDIRTTPITI